MVPEAPGVFTFDVFGAGMKSVIKTGDRVKVLRLPPEDLRPGDIIVFMTATWGAPERPKRLAIHRLLAKSRGADGQWLLWAKPESRGRLNKPIPASALLGKVVAISADGQRWTDLPPAVSSRPAA